jgi:hypothetical protein
MERISPDEILRRHGKWVESSKFAELVAKKRNVGSRQARNIIKRESKEIIKHVFSDRTVIYGLPEFGPPKFKNSKGKGLAKSDFYRTLIQQFWKERERVMRLRSQSSMLDILDAWELTRRFAEIMPESDQKRHLIESIKKTHEEATTNGLTDFVPNFFSRDKLMFASLDPAGKVLDAAIPKIWEEIASILQGS